MVAGQVNLLHIIRHISLCSSSSSQQARKRRQLRHLHQRHSPMPPNSSPHAYTQHSWGYNMAQPHLQMQSHPQQAAASPMMRIPVGISTSSRHRISMPTSMPVRCPRNGIRITELRMQECGHNKCSPSLQFIHPSLSTANTFTGHSMPGFQPQTGAAGAYAHTNVPIYGNRQGAHAQSASGPPSTPQQHQPAFNQQPTSSRGTSPSNNNDILAALVDALRNDKDSRDLTSSEVTSLTTGLDPLSIVSWLPRWIGIAQLRNPDILSVLALSIDQLGAVITSDPKLAKADRWMARNLQVCFDPTKESVIAYNQMLPLNTALMRSGGLLVDKLKQMSRLNSGTDIRSAEAEYKAQTFFKMGMTPDGTRVNGWKCIVQHQRLPEYKGVVSTLLALIRKMPDQVSKRRDELEEKVYEHEACGTIPWTQQQLIEIIAIAIGKGSPSASAAEAPPPSPASGNIEELIAAAAERIANRQKTSPTPSGPKRCLNCGSTEHTDFKQCTQKGACGFGYCPCNITVGTNPNSVKVCVVQRNSDVPKQILNAMGSALKPHLHAKLVKANRVHRGLPEASAAEANDDDAHDDEAIDDDAEAPPGQVNFYTGSIELNPQTADEAPDDGRSETPLLNDAQQPTDGPPHHEHRWVWGAWPCRDCDSPEMWKCICGASWCSCLGVPRPAFGPALPGPVWNAVGGTAGAAPVVEPVEPPPPNNTNIHLLTSRALVQKAIRSHRWHFRQYAALRIQRAWRAYADRPSHEGSECEPLDEAFIHELKARVVIQSAWRRVLAKRTLACLLNAHQSAVVIQCAWRCAYAHYVYAKRMLADLRLISAHQSTINADLEPDVIIIQQAWRMHARACQARRERMLLEFAQAAKRMNDAWKRDEAIQRRNNAARKVQKKWRAYRQLTQLRILLALRRNSARLIQAQWHVRQLQAKAAQLMAQAPTATHVRPEPRARAQYSHARRCMQSCLVIVAAGAILVLSLFMAFKPFATPCAFVAMPSEMRHNMSRTHCAASAAASGRKHQVQVQLDGGSNCKFVNDVEAQHLGIVTSQRPVSIAGIGAAADVSADQVVDIGFRFSDGRSILVDKAFYAPGKQGARRTLLPESWLLKQHGIEVLKKEMILRWADGHSTPIYEDNELYFIDVELIPPHQVERARPEASLAVRADELAMLWAARLGVNADKLVKVSNAVHGIGISSVARATAELIDADIFRRFACSKKKPTSDTPVVNKAQCAGEGFHCDTTGKHAAPSVADGAHFGLHAVCEYTDFGYIATSKHHTIEVWLEFIRHVILDARAAGHNPKWVRFDQAPELRSDILKTRIEAELGVLVQLAPRTHPVGINAAERTQGQLTVQAEADMQRAEKGPAWLLPATVYAQYRRNRMPAAPFKETRYQRYRNKAPTISAHLTPHLFCTRVLIHEDKAARGVKGSLDKPRATNGTFIGIEDGAAHNLVIKDGGGLIKPRQVDALDEVQLLRRGRASSATLTDVQTQTDVTHACKLQPPPAQPTKAPPPPLVTLNVGDRVAVKWTPSGGGEKQEYIATVTAIEGQLRQRLWTVKYDGWDGELKHNFDTTKRHWRRVDVVPKAAAQRPNTRASLRVLSAASAQIDQLLEFTPEHERVDNIQCGHVSIARRRRRQV